MNLKLDQFIITIFSQIQREFYFIFLDLQLLSILLHIRKKNPFYFKNLLVIHFVRLMNLFEDSVIAVLFIISLTQFFQVKVRAIDFQYNLYHLSNLGSLEIGFIFVNFILQ